MPNEIMENVNVATTAVTEAAADKHDLKGIIFTTLGFTAGIGVTILIPKAVKSVKNKISAKKEQKAAKNTIIDVPAE